MDPQIALKIALASAAIAASGALGSQLISALFSLKVKRLEIVFARKADTYKNLMEKAGAFANDIQSPERYLEFIHAYYATLIIASPSVLQAFTAQENITDITSRLQTVIVNPDEQERLKKSWLNAMNILANAMREDLRTFSKH
jgi:hypothetical protein